MASTTDRDTGSDSSLIRSASPNGCCQQPMLAHTRTWQMLAVAPPQQVPKVLHRVQSQPIHSPQSLTVRKAQSLSALHAPRRLHGTSGVQPQTALSAFKSNTQFTPRSQGVSGVHIRPNITAAQSLQFSHSPRVLSVQTPQVKERQVQRSLQYYDNQQLDTKVLFSQVQMVSGAAAHDGGGDFCRPFEMGCCVREFSEVCG